MSDNLAAERGADDGVGADGGRAPAASAAALARTEPPQNEGAARPIASTNVGAPSDAGAASGGGGGGGGGAGGGAASLDADAANASAAKDKSR